MSFFTTLNLFNLSVNPKNSVILVARSKRKGVLKKDQIRFMEILAKSVADRDPSLVKEILLILGRAMYSGKTDSDLEALMEYRHLMYLARRVKDRVRKRLAR